MNGATAKTGGGRWPWFVLVLVLLVVAALRVRLLGVPLERDEGEYAYVGQLILQGIPPYQLAYTMKLPGTHLVNALVLTLFGQSVAAVHTGLLLANLATMVLLFLLGRRLSGPLAGLGAAAVYGRLSFSSAVLGFAAHATQFVTLFAVAGLWLLWTAVEDSRPRRFVWSGVLIGLAILCKQPGILFLLFALAWLLWRRMRGESAEPRRVLKDAGALASGAAAPLALVALWLLAMGVFGEFWFWVVRYATAYGAQIPLREAWPLFRYGFAPIIEVAPVVWAVVAVGAALLLWKRPGGGRTSFLAGVLVFAFLSACPGFYFRQHYFVPFLAAAALLAGWALGRAADLCGARRRWLAAVPIVVFVAALVQTAWSEKELLFQAAPAEISRYFYGNNPFIESPVIARFIAERTTPTDTIAVVGSEPQIYFYAQRRSATGYIYTYGLMEKQPYAEKMQQEMIHEIETSRPKFLLFVACNMSWLRSKQSADLIFRWIGNYMDQHFDVVGLVDLPDTGAARYVWGLEAAQARPQSGAFVVVGQRRTVD